MIEQFGMHDICYSLGEEQPGVVMNTKVCLSAQTSLKTQHPQAHHIDFSREVSSKEILFSTFTVALGPAPASRTLTKRYFRNYIVFFFIVHSKYA